MSPAARLASRLALLLLGSALGLFLADRAVGWADPYGISYFDHQRTFSEACLRDADTPGRNRVREPIPGTAVDAGVLYRINALGFRGAETTREKPAGTWRVVVIGDSVAFGWGVAVEDRFTDVAERKLAESRGGGPRIEILNLGVPGYEANAHWWVLTAKALPLQPDAIVIAFISNDVQLVPAEVEALAHEHPEKSAGRSTLGRILTSGRSFRTLDALVPNLRRLGVYFALVRANPTDPRGTMPMLAKMTQGIQIATDIYADAARRATKAGARFALFDLTGFDVMAARCAARGIPYADLSVTDRADPGRLRVSAVDAHPNAEAHRLIAERFVEALSTHGLLPDTGHAPHGEDGG